jgi:hypothetical protein
MRVVRWTGRRYAAGSERPASLPTLVPHQPDDIPVDPRGFAIQTQKKVVAHYRQLLAISNPTEPERQLIESRLARAEAELAEI